MKTTGFRSISGPYLYYVTCVKMTRAQSSPFILISKDEIKAITHSGTLFEVAKDTDTILHAWPGQWRTDIFAYTFKEFKDAMKKYDVSIFDFGKLTHEHHTKMYAEER